MSTPNFSKKSSTENAAAKGKSRSGLVQDGNLMAGNSSGEYEYLRLQKLKAEIQDHDGKATPALARLPLPFAISLNRSIWLMIYYYNSMLCLITRQNSHKSRLYVVQEIAWRLLKNYHKNIVIITLQNE